MFKLNHESYVKFLESVQELERVLLEELDNQQEIEGRVQNIWTDADKKLVADMYKYAIEKHDDSMIKRIIEGCADE